MDDTAFVALYIANRALEQLRRTLFDATGASQFAREHDAIDAVKWFWAQQAAARARVFSHTLAVGARPKAAEPPPWAPEIARLRELPVPVVKEEEPCLHR